MGNLPSGQILGCDSQRIRQEIKAFPLEERHLPQVLAVEAASFADPWSEAAFRGELASPLARYFVAVRTSPQGEEVLGYGGLQRVLDESYITNVAVLPPHRGQGVGAVLLDALVEAARRDGGSLITLEVRPSNTAALALYRSRGFAQVGVRKGFYRHPTEDALLLTLRFEGGA